MSVKKLRLPTRINDARYLPERRQLAVAHDQLYFLLDLQGRIVDAVESYPSMDRNRLIQALWDLTAPEIKVRGGKIGWVPLSHSSNLKIWLLRSAKTNELSLLRF